MPPAEAPKTIPPEEQIKLWVRAGGRCQLCNTYLLEDDLTRVPKKLGELAHNVGRKQSGRSPRGLTSCRSRSGTWPRTCCCSAANTTGHRRQGRPGRVHCRGAAQDQGRAARTHPLPDRSRRRRRDRRRARRPETSAERPWGSPTTPSGAAVPAHARRFPRSPSAIRGRASNRPGRATADGGHRRLLERRRRQIDNVINGQLRDGIERGEVRHLSVFGLARIPLLVLLGGALDDKLAIDLYQPQRPRRELAWARTPTRSTFEYDDRPRRRRPATCRTGHLTQRHRGTGRSALRGVGRRHHLRDPPDRRPTLTAASCATTHRCRRSRTATTPSSVDSSTPSPTLGRSTSSRPFPPARRSRIGRGADACGSAVAADLRPRRRHLHLRRGDQQVKLVSYFKHFLENTVNLNQSRIDQLDERLQRDHELPR